MIAAIETYLAVRRAAGFALTNTEYLLRSFAGFATAQKQTDIRTATVIRWASQARSVAQRHILRPSEIPIIDQHNFRAMNYFCRAVRPAWRLKSKPDTYGELATLASFLSEIRSRWAAIDPSMVPMRAHSTGSQ